MLASLMSEESLSQSGHTPSSLSAYHPSSTSTTASSGATSPLLIATTNLHPSVTRCHTATEHSLPPLRDQTVKAASLPRVLAEEDRVIARLREQVSELATELRVQTKALESARERMQSTDKRMVELHQKYLAEAAARMNVESETGRAQEETRHVQIMLDFTQGELTRSKREIEHLEAERAGVESAAAWVRGMAPESKHKEEMAAAIEYAFKKGRAEGVASMTMKALAAFGRLIESHELDSRIEY